MGLNLKINNLHIMNIKEITAFYKMNYLSGRELVDYSAKLVKDGYNSTSLYALAGEIDYNIDNIKPVFEKAMDELGVKIPQEMDAYLIIAQYYAQKIIDKKISPYEGAKQIWRKVSDEIENASELILFFEGAASEIEDLTENSSNTNKYIKAYEKDIINASKKLVKIKNSKEILKT